MHPELLWVVGRPNNPLVASDMNSPKILKERKVSENSWLVDAGVISEVWSIKNR